MNVFQGYILSVLKNDCFLLRRTIWGEEGRKPKKCVGAWRRECVH